MKNLFSKKITTVRKDVIGQCLCGDCLIACGGGCWVSCESGCFGDCTGQCGGCGHDCLGNCTGINVDGNPHPGE